MKLELLALLLFIAIILFAFLVFSLVNIIVHWIRREESEYKDNGIDELQELEEAFEKLEDAI